MRETIAWIVVGILVALLGVGGYMYYTNSKALKEEKAHVQYWETEGFKTLMDTLDIRYSSYIDKRPVYNITVPEKEILTFKNENPLNRSLIKANDSLYQVVDSLGAVISNLDRKYITLYPDNPKLLSGFFSRDSLRLELLNIDGTITSHLWLTDYERYKYGFKNNTLTTARLPEPPLVKRKFISLLEHDLFTHVGYDFPLQAGYIQGDYYLHWRKVVFAAHLGSTLERHPNLEARIGFGYKPF